MEIGNNIQRLRKENNYSQEQLAEMMNVARQTISKWELSQTYPDINEAIMLSKIFRVSLDELTGNDNKNILIQKVSNTERLAGTIIKLLKVFGISLLVLFVLIIIIMILRKYYEASPDLMVADSLGIYCTLNDEKYYYEVTTLRDKPGVLELNDNAISLLKKMKVDINKYSSKELLIKDIEDYIVSIDGICK